MVEQTITERRVGKSPCYKCQERHAGCHAECEKYAEWRAKMTKSSEEHMGAYLRDKAADEFLINGGIKARDRKRKAQSKYRRRHP